MSGLEVRYVKDTLADPPAPPPVLVEGMLRAGELCVIGAPRASGKSWLAMNLAALVARGDGSVFGTLPVHHGAPVLLCHGETPAWMAAERWRSLLGTCDPGPLAESFDRWRVEVVRTRHQLRSEDGAETHSEDATEGRLDERLRQAVVEHGIRLLIVDPLATFYCGSENSNDEIEAALDTFRLLAGETGTAIVIVHHLGKATSSRDPEDLWRGASRLADAASTRITLLPAYSDDEVEQRGLSPDAARRHMTVRFLRRERPTDGFTARLGPDGWWQPVTERAPALRSMGSTARYCSPDEVATALRADGGTWPSVSAASSSLELSKPATTAALERAVEAGLIEERRGRSGARAFSLAMSPSDERATEEDLR